MVHDAADDGRDVRHAAHRSLRQKLRRCGQHGTQIASLNRPHHGRRAGQDAEALSDIRLWPRLALDRTRPGRNPRIDLRNEGHDRTHLNALPAGDRLVGPRAQDSIGTDNPNLR